MNELIFINIRSESKQGQYVFDIPTVANVIGVSAYDLLNHLQILKVCSEALLLHIFMLDLFIFSPTSVSGGRLVVLSSNL